MVFEGLSNALSVIFAYHLEKHDSYVLHRYHVDGSAHRYDYIMGNPSFVGGFDDDSRAEKRGGCAFRQD